MAYEQFWTINKGQADEFRVYGRTENWNFFVETPSEDESNCGDPATIVKTNDVKQHNRRRYPGDKTPATVDGHERQVLSGAKRTSGGAKPGKTLILATNPATWDDGDEKRQFQYVGDFKHVFIYLQKEASKDIIVYNHSGTRYKICEETGEIIEGGQRAARV